MRYPYAAEQFLSEYQEINSRAKMEPVDEPDGFGVHRAFRFDKTSSKVLARTLGEVDDERIESVEETADGLVVIFTGRTIADLRDPFMLAEARTVADGQQSSAQQPEGEGDAK